MRLGGGHKKSVSVIPSGSKIRSFKDCSNGLPLIRPTG